MKANLTPNTLCLGCIALPAIGFGAGLLAIPFPAAVLYASLAVIAAGWIGALRWVSRADAQATAGAAGAANALAVLGTLFGLGAGLLVAGEGSIHLPIILIAFTLGLVGGLIYRTRIAAAQTRTAAAVAWNEAAPVTGVA
jgi:hypothetical protein